MPHAPSFVDLLCKDISGFTKCLDFFLVLRASIDGDGDGDISKEEFVKNAMESKFINDILNKSSN